jgi:hypothetical protein
MKLLLYLNGTKANAERLQHAVEGAGTGHHIEFCYSVAGLLQRFRLGRSDLAVVILFASDRTHLAEFLSIGDWLNDLRTILILPDRDSDTITQGLTLRPRYLTFADTDFSDVSAVLAKMLRLCGKESKGLSPSNSKPLL